MNKTKSLYTKLVVLHVLIGVVVFLFEPIAKIYLFASVFIFFIKIIKNKNKENESLLAAAYITGGEVFFRLTDAAIPYELGKYAVIGFLLLGLLFNGASKKSGIYWLYLSLLVPGIIYSAINLGYEASFRKTILFSLSGPFCLGIAAMYCVDRKVNLKQLQYICWCLLMPIITMGVYLYFYTPDTRDALTGTASNFATSGGFGPNQVATALGLGMFLLFVQLFTQSKQRINFFINLGLLSLISYRAIVTFSRGGVFTAIIISIIFIVFYYKMVNHRAKQRSIVIILFIAIASIFTWSLSSSRTEGLIDKRYTNRNAHGVAKEDVSTGRGKLISSELSAFVENPITGIGVGNIKEHRIGTIGVVAASHNEISRLLSEHGIAGIIALIILTLYPLYYRMENNKNFLFFSVFGFWFLTINHSSMRIAAPAFIYGLSLLNIVYEKKDTVHRKRIVS